MQAPYALHLPSQLRPPSCRRSTPSNAAQANPPSGGSGVTHVIGSHTMSLDHTGQALCRGRLWSHAQHDPCQIVHPRRYAACGLRGRRHHADDRDATQKFKHNSWPATMSTASTPSASPGTRDECAIKGVVDRKLHHIPASPTLGAACARDHRVAEL